MNYSEQKSCSSKLNKKTYNKLIIVKYIVGYFQDITIGSEVVPQHHNVLGVATCITV